VLNNPQVHSHAFFCFRDPRFLRDVPGELLRVFAEFPTDDELRDLTHKAARKCAVDRRRKLRELKQNIRNANLPTRTFENYPCQFAGLRINRRIARMELSESDRQSLEQVTAGGIVSPEEFRALDERLRAIVSGIGTASLSGLKEFGQRIHDWLWQAIKSELKLDDQPATAETDSLAEESDFHERFMESRLRVHVRRKSLRNQLAEYANGNQTMPALVTGGSGSGKSAALAQFVRVYRRARRRDTTVIAHFIGASPGSTSLRQMLRRLCRTLKQEFAFADEVPEDMNELLTQFRNFVANVPADRRALIVIDAVNQLDETDNAEHMHWLPRDLPAQVKIIVSCIADTDRAEPALAAFAHRPHQRISIAPLTSDEQGKIIHAVPSLSAKTLDEVQVGLLLSNPATENPLFLLVALEELRGYGSFDQLDSKIATFPHPQEQEPLWHQWLLETLANARNLEALAISSGDEAEATKWRDQRNRLERLLPMLQAITPCSDPATAIFTEVIERLTEDFDAELVKTVLTLLASARRGMSERELLDMVEGVDVPITASQCDLFPVLRQLRPYLLSRAGLIDFYHRNLFKAVRERCLPSEEQQRQAHVRLAEYFNAQDYWLESLEEQQRRAKTLPPTPRPANVRKVDELPWQLLQAVDWESSEQLLTDLAFLEAKAETGMVFDLAADFSAAIGGMPADRPLLRILRLLEDALRRDIHFIPRHPTTLFQCFWNSCWWYDCPQAEPHFEEPAGGRIEPPPWDRSGPKLHKLLERWREEKERASRAHYWLRSLRPPPFQLGAGQQGRLSGHPAPVTGVACSPVSRQIASGCDDGKVRVWDAETGEELLCMRSHGGQLLSLAYSPDGRRIVSGSKDKTIRIWDAQSGEEVRCLRGHEGEVWSVTYAADGRRIASGGSFDRTVRVWDAESGEELVCLRGHQDAVTSVAYSPDGCRLASGSFDKTVRVWDTESAKQLRCMEGHEDAVWSVTYAPDGRRIASGSGSLFFVLIGSGRNDSTVRVWDAESEQELLCLYGHKAYVRSIAYSPNGRRLASGSSDRTVRLWDAMNGEDLACLHGHVDAVTSVAYFPDGKQLVSASLDRTLRLWQGETGGDELLRLRGHEMTIQAVAYSTDGRRLATASNDTTARVWDANSGRELLRLVGHERRIWSVWYSLDARRIVSQSDDSTVRVWDAENGEELMCRRGTLVIARMDFDSESHANGSVRLWDAETYRYLSSFGAVFPAGPQFVPWRAMTDQTETWIEHTASGRPVTWFPYALDRITSHPQRRAWAGAIASYLGLVALEGGTAAT
jgi:WD40 repeat protein